MMKEGLTLKTVDVTSDTAAEMLVSRWMNDMGGDGDSNMNRITEAFNALMLRVKQAEEDKADISQLPEPYSHPLSHPADMISGLAAVAVSGSYKDLSDAPQIPDIPTPATAERDGLLCAEDKCKLNKLAADANAVYAGKSDLASFYPKPEIDDMLDRVVAGEGADLTGYYKKTEIDLKLDEKVGGAELAAVARSGSYNDLRDKPGFSDAYVHPASHPADMITGLREEIAAGVAAHETMETPHFVTDITDGTVYRYGFIMRGGNLCVKAVKEGV